MELKGDPAVERGGRKIKGQCALFFFFHCLLWHVQVQLDATHTFDQTLIIQLVRSLFFEPSWSVVVGSSSV